MPRSRAAPARWCRCRSRDRQPLSRRSSRVRSRRRKREDEPSLQVAYDLVEVRRTVLGLLATAPRVALSPGIVATGFVPRHEVVALSGRKIALFSRICRSGRAILEMRPSGHKLSCALLPIAVPRCGTDARSARRGIETSSSDSPPGSVRSCNTAPASKNRARARPASGPRMTCRCTSEGPRKSPRALMRRSMPAPDWAESQTRRAAPASSVSTRGISLNRSALLKTSICGKAPAPTSSSTFFTCATRSLRFGSAASMTCSRHVASRASWSVERNAATSSCGKSRTNPTVSASSA